MVKILTNLEAQSLKDLLLDVYEVVHEAGEYNLLIRVSSSLDMIEALQQESIEKILDE